MGGFSGGIQVKICGLTRVAEALACAELGAHAVGCVFFPRSPRFVDDRKAREICGALPAGVGRVGVFVNEDFSGIMRRIDHCGINGVQLHGGESPELVRRLTQEGIVVIKTLFVNAAPSIGDARLFEPTAFLVEASGGILPGGNALTWDWGAVGDHHWEKPLVLAGGLDEENVSTAIEKASPDMVDVSSGVEAQPGRKDLEKVRRFLLAASKAHGAGKVRKLF